MSRTSSTPNPVSTRTRPSSDSTSRQWQTKREGSSRPPSPAKRRRPCGHIVPQLRWCSLIYRWRRAGVAGLAYAIASKSIALTGLWVRVPPPASSSGGLRRAVLGRRAGAVVFARADQPFLLDVPLLIERVEGDADQDDLDEGEDDDQQADHGA